MNDGLLEERISLTQYLRPNGQTRRVHTYLTKELADKAKNIKLSCEALPGETMVIYGRRYNEPEEAELTEMAENGPGNNTPDMALERLIKRFE